MPPIDITKKAKQILARRSAPNDPWFYVRSDWRRQVIFIAFYIAIPISLWLIGWTMVAVAAASFFAATKIRDVRWWVALSKEWPATSELLDWPKIETIANDDVNL